MVAMVDLRHCGDVGAAAREIEQREARRPFNLAEGPLVRAILLRLGDDDHVLLVTMHHVVGDGWSIGVLIREFTLLYDAASAARHRSPDRGPLPALPIQYADFAVWQRQYLRGEALDEQLAYWRRQLDGLAALNLPTDYARPAVLTDGARACRSSCLPASRGGCER